MRRTFGLVAVVLVSLLGLTACFSIPMSGPVVDAGQTVPPNQGEGYSIVPRPPLPGASASDIVAGFLDAMQATPIQTKVAREFLASSIASSWNPEHETITYADKTPPRGDRTLTVTLSGAEHLDERGTWLGALPEQRSTLTFPMVKEKGEWRIQTAPNALIVPQSWFQTRFAQQSIYFFDPTGRVLVPELVFVPTGTQLATSLVQDIVAGPPRDLDGVVRSFVPSGLSAGLSVPIDADGVAQIDLTGDPGQLSDHEITLLGAQFAWTLRQVPGIESFQVTIGDRQLQLPGGTDVISVASGQQYDPAGYTAGGQIYGLDKGAVVVRDGRSFTPVQGPLGAEHAYRSTAVSVGSEWAAAVTLSGHSLDVAPLDTDGTVRRLVSGSSLLTPAWDVFGGLWTLDRTHAGAVVSWTPVTDKAATKPVVLDVPGVTGEDVRSFLVARDGSRLVADVRGSAGDTLVVSRIQRDDRGNVIGATGATTISDFAVGARVEALAWYSPTAVAALQQLSDTSLVRTYSVDGAASAASRLSLTVGDRLTALLGSPASNVPLYAISDDDLIDLSGDVSQPLPKNITSLGYVG